MQKNLESNKIRPLTYKERNALSQDAYLKIETDFHNNYAGGLNWEEPISEFYSYERDKGRYGREAEELFVAWLDDIKGKTILDIGSGHGNTALKLAQRGGEVTSIDIAPKLIEGCRYRAAKNNLHINFEVMDAGEMTFADNSFDVIVGFRTIHHLPDIERFFFHAHRCLKPGGFILLVEPQKYNPFVEAGRYFIKNNAEDRTPTEHPLVPADISLMKKVFGNLQHKEFEFLASACLVLKMIRLNSLLRLLLPPAILLDRAIRKIDLFRPLYWQVVLKSYKQS
jgi:2-polyprenyl-3-methyl-5-hydroxy-6-metoxy-1,4-benzoquinol methylase